MEHRKKASLARVTGLDPPLGDTNPALRWHPLLLASASSSAKHSIASSVRANSNSNPDDMLVIRRSGTTLTNISATRGGAGSSRDDGSPRVSEAGSSCLGNRSSEDSVARARYFSGSVGECSSGRSSGEAGQQRLPQCQQLQQPAKAMLAHDVPAPGAGCSSSSAAAGMRDVSSSRDQSHAHISIAVHAHSAAAAAAAPDVDTGQCGQQQQHTSTAAEAEGSSWLSSLWWSAAAVGQQQEQQQLQQQHPLQPPPVVTVV